MKTPDYEVCFVCGSATDGSAKVAALLFVGLLIEAATLAVAVLIYFGQG
jgi:hypothetical protein